MATSIDVFAKIHDNERVAQAAAARSAGLLPFFREVQSPARPVVEMEGAPRIMLGSNNYLGLTADERVMQGARDALERYGTGLTGSRFLNGTTALHLELEHELADWMGTDAAIVFTTGHQANLATIGTLLGPGDTVVVDSGDHASLMDGAIQSRAKLRAFRHNRPEKLEQALAKASRDGGGVLVVVDGVFSMEGDIAPLPEIVELCQLYGARLMVDEAHAVGVLGARGAGSCELLGVEDQVDLRMGTFSKSLASCGGFIAGNAEVIEFLRLQSRAFLFTASGVPAALGAALAALRVIRSPEGPELMARVLANGTRLNRGLHELQRRRSAPDQGRGWRDGDGHDADRADKGRRRLEVRPALARSLRRGHLHERGAPPRRADRRRATAHERDGHTRRGDPRPGTRHVRHGQARVRSRARTASRA
jgi:8-amino-7-oxononanoate synthase